MTVWNKTWSWSKLKLAMTCPLALQWEIDRKLYTSGRNNWHSTKGTIVQKLFELYFNQKINLKPKGRTEEVLKKCLAKLFESPIFTTLDVDYPPDKGVAELKAEIQEDVLKGFELMSQEGIVTQAVASEQKWTAQFRNIRLYAQIDFQFYKDGAINIFDGKGHQQKNADERQLKTYGLVVAAAGQKLGRGAFLYWKHDSVDVDISPAGIKKFIEEDLDPVMPVLLRLKNGLEHDEVLPHKPSPENCFHCGWRTSCEHSAYKKEPVEDTTPTQVGFKEM